MDGLLPDRELNLNGVVSEDSFSDEEAKNNGDLVEELNSPNVNVDNHLLHINEQYEDNDLPADKCDSTFEIPSNDLINEIVKQVEYYFSDENLVKDTYLRKFVEGNKSGLVEVKLISNFKKMKKLTNSCEVVAYAIEKASTKLVLNENKKKVRRIDPLPPQRDFSGATKVLLANNLPSLSVETLKEIFEKYGRITKIEVVELKENLPENVKEALSSRKSKVSTVPVAVVEYELRNSASRASKDLKNNSDWRTGIRAEILAKLLSRTGIKDKENKAAGIHPDDQAEGTLQPKQSKLAKKTNKKKPAAKKPITPTAPNHGRNFELDNPFSPSPAENFPLCDLAKRAVKSPREVRLQENSPPTDHTDEDNAPTDQAARIHREPQEEDGRGKIANIKENLKIHYASLVGTLRNPRVPSDTKGFTTPRTFS